MDRRGIAFVGMGFELAGLMVGALYLGQAIDNYYSTKGLAVAGLTIVVLAGWLVHLVVLLKKYTRDNP